METDVEKWFKEEGEKVLKEIGIKKGNIILDFGCGAGTYSLPAAKIIGKRDKFLLWIKAELSLMNL